MKVLDPSPGALCLPQAMWMLYRTVMDRPDLSGDEVLDLAVPPAMRSRTSGDGAHAERALKALREFNLVEVGADGLFRADKVKDAASFIRKLRWRLVTPPEAVASDFEGAPDLRSGLVWLLRQSPLNPLSWRGEVQIAMPAGLFTNDTRWNGFRQWSVALGFSLPALTALTAGLKQTATGEKIVANPTSAVIDAIRHPFGEPLPRNEQLPISRLLDFLRAELPVLPGHPSATYPGLGDDPSDIEALGLALSTAEARQILGMEYQSDPSGVMALRDAQDYGHTRYVSAVTIKG